MHFTDILQTSPAQPVRSFFIMNTGNIILESDKAQITISKRFSEILNKDFGVETKNLIISAEHLKEIMENAPEWWIKEDTSRYRNLILIMKDSSYHHKK